MQFHEILWGSNPYRPNPPWWKTTSLGHPASTPRKFRAILRKLRGSFFVFSVHKTKLFGVQCINGFRVVNVIYVKHARIGDVWVVTLCSRRSKWYDAEQCCSAKCWINFSEKWWRRSLQNTVSIASRLPGLLRISKGKNSACRQKASQTSLRFLTNNFQSTLGNFPEGFVQSLGTLGAKVPVFGVSQLPRWINDPKLAEDSTRPGPRQPWLVRRFEAQRETVLTLHGDEPQSSMVKRLHSAQVGTMKAPCSCHCLSRKRHGKDDIEILYNPVVVRW